MLHLKPFPLHNQLCPSGLKPPKSPRKRVLKDPGPLSPTRPESPNRVQKESRYPKLRKDFVESSLTLFSLVSDFGAPNRISTASGFQTPSFCRMKPGDHTHNLRAQGRNSLPNSSTPTPACRRPPPLRRMSGLLLVSCQALLEGRRVFSGCLQGV